MKKSKRIEEKVKELELLKAHAKNLYAQVDELQNQLIEKMGIDVPYELSDGRVAKIHNNFVDKDGNPKNVAWGHGSVRLYELKVK